MFQGLPRLKNYRQATIDFNATRACEWTPEMDEFWLLNTSVNMSGKPDKFLAIDEFNEWIVRALKRVYKFISGDHLMYIGQCLFSEFSPCFLRGVG